MLEWWVILANHFLLRLRPTLVIFIFKIKKKAQIVNGQIHITVSTFQSTMAVAGNSRHLVKQHSPKNNTEKQHISKMKSLEDTLDNLNLPNVTAIGIAKGDIAVVLLKLLLCWIRTKYYSTDGDGRLYSVWATLRHTEISVRAKSSPCLFPVYLNITL